MSSDSCATASTRSVPHPAPCYPHVLMLSHHQRASRIGEFFGDPQDPNVRATTDRFSEGVAWLAVVVLG